MYLRSLANKECIKRTHHSRYSLLEQRDRDKIIKLTGDQTTCTVKEADNDEAEHPSLQDDSNPGCLKLVLQGRNLSITY